MTQQGKTTGNLKLRSGPGMQYDPPLAFLVPDTPLEILGEEGDWWKVRVGGKEGYVGKKYVAVSAAPAAGAGEGEKPAADAGKGPAPATPVRLAAKPSPPKGISADAKAVDASRAPKPASTPKSTIVKPTVTKPAEVKPTVTKPKAPPPGSKKA
jgi:hypothetical protein